MLLDESRTAPSLKGEIGDIGTVTTVRKILVACNQLLLEFERLSIGYVLRLDFEKGKRYDILNGFCNKTVLPGMREVYDCDITDNLLYFIGAVMQL